MPWVRPPQERGWGQAASKPNTWPKQNGDSQNKRGVRSRERPTQRARGTRPRGMEWQAWQAWLVWPNKNKKQTKPPSPQGKEDMAICAWEGGMCVGPLRQVAAHTVMLKGSSSGTVMHSEGPVQAWGGGRWDRGQGRARNNKTKETSLAQTICRRQCRHRHKTLGHTTRQVPPHCPVQANGTERHKHAQHCCAMQAALRGREGRRGWGGGGTLLARGYKQVQRGRSNQNAHPHRGGA